MRPLLPFLFAIIFLPSCLSLKPVTTDQVENITINSASAEMIEVTLTLKINNPNRFAITVKKIDLNVEVSGLKLGKILVEDKVRIPASSITSQSFKFKTPLSSLGMAAIPAALALATKSEVQIHAEGSIRAKALLVSKSFAVNFTDGVRLDR
ncbi:MAG: LEA type 2 family protein [Bacteroidota bacterium]